jgi:hypothetical protein
MRLWSGASERVLLQVWHDCGFIKEQEGHSNPYCVLPSKNSDSPLLLHVVSVFLEGKEELVSAEGGLS